MNSLGLARCPAGAQRSFIAGDVPYHSLSLSRSTAVSRIGFREIGPRWLLRCVNSSSMVPSTQLVGDLKSDKLELACPVCYRPVESNDSKGVKGISFVCETCQKTYKSKGGIIDLTIPNEGAIAFGSSFFQIPLIAFVYERGYRDLFGMASFPGFDEEATRAQKLMEPARGDVIMDLSCGPGAFTRRFLATGEYKTVIAADFSEAMLEQCRGFLETDAPANMSKVVLLRADAARLPLPTSSLAAVHAAAAIHCWPNVLTSVAEISRVLRPGGVFVASTFLWPTPSALEKPLKPLRQALDQLQLSFAWFTEADLRAWVEACGLTNWYSYRRGIYILFSASKPE